MELHAVKTWVDVRRGGVVVVEDDVQNVVRDIKALDSRLRVYYNEQAGEFDIVEHCLDGCERLVFTVPQLDQRVLHRLHGTDHWHGQSTPDRGVLTDDEDFAAQMDAHNEAIEARMKEEAADKIHDAGERLVWAMDWAKNHHSVGGSIRVPKDIDG